MIVSAFLLSKRCCKDNRKRENEKGIGTFFKGREGNHATRPHLSH